MKFGDRELASCTVVWRMFIFASSITGQGSDYLILDLLSWWDINSGSSLSTMSRCLRVPRSSVQMVVCWVDGLKTVLVQITPADSVNFPSSTEDFRVFYSISFISWFIVCLLWKIKWIWRKCQCFRLILEVLFPYWSKYHLIWSFVQRLMGASQQRVPGSTPGWFLLCGVCVFSPGSLRVLSVFSPGSPGSPASSSRPETCC